MPSEVIAALIGIAGSFLGSFIGILMSVKLTAYRLEQLEKKVEKHNNIVERVYHLEDETKLEAEKHKEIDRRLSNLERLHPSK